MHETKFTPGPWRWTREGRHICLSPGVLITDETDGTPWGDFRDRPNAALIEAAPDLYDALKDTLRSARKDFEPGPDGEKQFREAYAEQFAALAKAEGRNE